MCEIDDGNDYKIVLSETGKDFLAKIKELRNEMESRMNDGQKIAFEQRMKNMPESRVYEVFDDPRDCIISECYMEQIAFKYDQPVTLVFKGEPVMGIVPHKRTEQHGKPVMKLTKFEDTGY